MVTHDPRPSLVYFGTPEFAVPALAALAKSNQFRILAVVTQPDRPAGRGQKLSQPAVKSFALSLGIPVFQPSSLKGIECDDIGKLYSNKAAAELTEFLNEHSPIDAFVCVAYGKIIPSPLLSFCRAGMVNIHPSLLPRWRGAAPIQRALFSGDTRTGVALMQIDEGLDSGPVYTLRDLPIEQDDDFGSLHDKLAELGADLLLEFMPPILSGELRPKPQDETGLTYAEKWEKEHSIIQWGEPAETTLNRIRASTPVPGARTELNGELVKIFRAHIVPDQNYRKDTEPGTIVESNLGELIVAAGQSQYIGVDEIQYAGRSRLPVKVAQRGRMLRGGDKFE